VAVEAVAPVSLVLVAVLVELLWVGYLQHLPVSLVLEELALVVLALVLQVDFLFTQV
jgi:hypothetical protein